EETVSPTMAYEKASYITRGCAQIATRRTRTKTKRSRNARAFKDPPSADASAGLPRDREKRQPPRRGIRLLRAQHRQGQLEERELSAREHAPPQEAAVDPPAEDAGPVQEPAVLQDEAGARHLLLELRLLVAPEVLQVLVERAVEARV